MALLFLYHNRQLLLLVSTALLAFFALVNLASINLIGNLQTVRALKGLAKSQKSGDFANFCKYVPRRYRQQWKNYCKATLPFAQSVERKPSQRKYCLVILAVLSCLITLAVFVVSVLYANLVSKLVCVVLLLSTACICCLICFKNKLANKVSAKLWSKLVLQVGTVFDCKLPFVVASAQQVDSLVEQIKLLKLNPNSHKDVQRLLRQTGLDGVRTAKQQRQINQALSNMLTQ